MIAYERQIVYKGNYYYYYYYYYYDHCTDLNLSITYKLIVIINMILEFINGLCIYKLLWQSIP